MTLGPRPGIFPVPSGSALDTLAELAGLLAGVVNDATLGSFLRAAVESALLLAGVSTAVIGVVNRDGRVHLVTASGRYPGAPDAAISARDAQALVAQFTRDPTALRSEDFLRRPGLKKTWGRTTRRQPVVAVPVIHGREIHGFVYLADTQHPSPRRAMEERVTRMIAALVASAVRDRQATVDPARHSGAVCRATTDAERFVRADGDAARADAFHEVAEGARRSAGAEVAVLVMPGGRGAHVMGVAGPGPATLAGREVLDNPDGLAQLLRQIGTAAHPTAEDFEGRWQQDWWRLVAQRGDILLVPIACDETNTGFVALARAKPAAGFSEQDTAVANTYATHLRHSVSTARASLQSQDLAVFAERERISRDLHDRVLQRLYATNLGLQHLRGQSPASPTEPSIDAAVANIDSIIRELRGTVNSLGAAPGMPDGLRGEVQEIVQRIAGGSRLDVRVRLLGPVDTAGVHPAVGGLLAALTEGLSNAVRHANAHVIEVEIVVSDDNLALTVSDDGSGFSPGRPGNGLKNLRRRADLAGGSFTVGPRHPRGTEVVWTVPRLSAAT